MNSCPCQHLVATSTPKCYIGRDFPVECSHCSAYEPGLTYEERARHDAWQQVTFYHHNQEYS